MKTRTQLNRGKKREEKNIDEIYKIIDESFLCYISFIRDHYPVVLPKNYGRMGNQIILHGATNSPFTKQISEAKDICINITILDGLVLGKSAFNHSVNFRSVVIYGQANIISNEIQKLKALKAMTNHVVPNRWDKVRAPTIAELKSTMVLSVPLNEISAKVRNGPPTVMSSDENFPIWSGVLPLELKPNLPIADKYSMGVKPTEEVTKYSTSVR